MALPNSTSRVVSQRSTAPEAQAVRAQIGELVALLGVGSALDRRDDANERLEVGRETDNAYAAMQGQQARLGQDPIEIRREDDDGHLALGEFSLESAGCPVEGLPDKSRCAASADAPGTPTLTCLKGRVTRTGRWWSVR